MATVVVVLSGTADRSSTPALAAVITASVVSGMISETELTKVVFPTPKPPPTMILTDVIAGDDAGLELAKSTEHPFQQAYVGLLSLGGSRLTQAQQPFVRHVGDEDPRHPERQPQERGDLGHRPPAAGQIHDRLILGSEGGHVTGRIRRDRHKGLDRQLHARTGPA